MQLENYTMQMKKHRIQMKIIQCKTVNYRRQIKIIQYQCQFIQTEKIEYSNVWHAVLLDKINFN